MSSLDYVPAVVLFGDSLTQASGPGSFYQRVAEYYTRKADVLNRGFSGYNTEWCLPVYKATFASKTAREAGHATPVKLMTLWLGANDSTPSSSFQHVPLDRYADNLLSLIKLSQSSTSSYHNPDIKIILITPPPFNPTQAAETFKANNPPGAKQDPLRVPEVTQQYAKACKDIAQKAGLPCIDLHQAIIDAAGGTEDRFTAAFFYDGLHLNATGYEILFHAFQSTLENAYPELVPSTINAAGGMPEYDVLEKDPGVLPSFPDTE